MITRREFLQCSAAVAASAMLPIPSRADTPLEWMLRENPDFTATDSLRELDKALVSDRTLVAAEGVRSGKSTLASVFFPAWYAKHNPGKRVGLFTESLVLSTYFASKTDALHPTEGYAGAVGSSTLGRGFDLVIVDICKRMMGVEFVSAYQWLHHVLPNRIYPGGRMVFVGSNVTQFSPLLSPRFFGPTIQMERLN